MLRLLSSLLGLLLFAAVGLVGLLLVVVEPDPTVAATAPPSAAEQRWAAALIDGSAGPGELGTVTLSAREADLILDLLLPRLADRLLPRSHARQVRAEVTLVMGGAQLALSVPLVNPRGWVNLELTLVQTDRLPRLSRISAGGIRLPVRLVRQALAPAWQSVRSAGLLQQVRFLPGEAQLAFGPTDALPANDSLLLAAAQQHLATLLAAEPRGDRDLAVLLSALIGAVAEGDVSGGDVSGRDMSGGDGAAGEAGARDPVAANSAALTALAGYVLTGRLPRSAVDAAGVSGIAGRRLVLRGRADLAKHYMASAALAVGAGGGLSGLIGLAKEFDDAERGSGFSFADLAANRAGIRFARLATQDAATARQVQRLAAVGFDQDAMMPAIAGLPEGIGQGAFARDYGGGRGGAYDRLVANIDQRIDGLPLFRDLAALDN